VSPQPAPIVLAIPQPAGAVEAAGFLHRVAGFELWSPRPLGPGARPAKRRISSPRVAESAWSVVHDGPGLDLGELRRVVSLRDASGQYRFDYEDGESFVVDAIGSRIERRPGTTGEATATRSLERALGAPLIVALAIRGVHVLHASAIALGGAAVAFTAAPGVGKSTLAAAAERSTRRDWRRISDDLLPVRLGPSASALPHFPQPKLSSSAQYPAASPESLPLRALVVLERGAEEAHLSLARLEAARGAIALAEATVAARWFDRELLASHLAACAATCGAVQVMRLVYPSGLGRLEEVLDALSLELA